MELIGSKYRFPGSIIASFELRRQDRVRLVFDRAEAPLPSFTQAPVETPVLLRVEQLRTRHLGPLSLTLGERRLFHEGERLRLDHLVGGLSASYVALKKTRRSFFRHQPLAARCIKPFRLW